MANLESVTSAILHEIQGVMGLAGHRWLARVVRSLFQPSARRLAGLLVQLDHDAARCGLGVAADNLLAGLVQEYRVKYSQTIPQVGPLMVVSNHPGAYDLLILAATIVRDDLKVISSDIAIFRHLPSIAPHFIPITGDPYRRMAAVRVAIQHLLDGRALLIFPRGDVEIDPALSPRAVDGIAHWSPSLELLIRKAPQTSVVVAIVSGVLSSCWFSHPVLRLWAKTEQRQKVAEIIQVAEQLILRKNPQLTPVVSFSPPRIYSEAAQASAPAGQLMEILAQSARSQMAVLNAHLFG